MGHAHVRSSGSGPPHDEDARRVHGRRDDPTALISAVGVSKSYGGRALRVRKVRPVLVDVDVELLPGEVVGLVGENGSGKSTLMKILVGALPADGGTITRSGSLGYCPQEPLVYARLTCAEHFALFARAYRLSDADARENTDEILEALGFVRYRDTRADRLSGGTLAKLNLGLALLPDPDILMLDEPYAGFDWDTYLRFWELVEERRGRGKTVLIVSHFVVDEHRFSRIVEIRDGRTWTR